MPHLPRYVVTATAVLLCCLLVPALASPIRYSTYGGAKQIWLPVDSFTSQSAFVADPATPAANTLSGQAYNFPGPPSSPPGDQQDWWVEYTIPGSALPPGFITPGSTWGFFARASSSSLTAGVSVDSDWLLVAGDPGDGAANSTATITPGVTIDGQPAQRILNNIQMEMGYFAYNFGWMSEAYGTGNKVRTKIFNPTGGNITFRIYEREADPLNALIDVICFTTDISGTLPTDAQFLDATIVPEPASFAVLGVGALQALVLLRRKRSS